MKKLLAVAGFSLLALAGCQSGESTTGDDIVPAEENQVNEIVMPSVDEVAPVEVTLPGAEELPVVDSAVSTEVEAN